jgi:hypothetical protein
MKNEFYIIHLIRSNEEARCQIAMSLGLPPGLPWQQLFLHLNHNDFLRDMSTRFGCKESEVFTALRQIIEQNHVRIKPLTTDDFYWLSWRGGRTTISGLLRCPVGEALQRLFDSEQLEHLLQDAGVVDEQQMKEFRGDSERLLNKFLSRDASRKLGDYWGSSNRWEILEVMLHDQARQELSWVLNCPLRDVLTHLVARIRENYQGEPLKSQKLVFGEGKGFDFIALSKLRSICTRLERTIFESSRQFADFAKSRLLGYRIAGDLPALINYYIGGYFKSALEDILYSKQPLRLLEFSKATTSPDMNLPETAILQIVSEPVLGNSEKVDVIIQCRTHDSQPVQVLKLSEVGTKDIQHLQSHLPRTIGDLPQIGATLSERLLNTFFPLAPGWRKSLREAISKQGDDNLIDEAFVQCFVLSGGSLSPKLIAPNLPVSENIRIDHSPDTHVEFPKTPKDIAEILQIDYERKKRPVEPIKL